MNWHTAEELRLDEEKRVQNWLASERLIESLNELKKKRKQKNDAKKAVKSRIKKSLTSSRCPVRLQKQPMLRIVQRNSKGRGRGPKRQISECSASSESEAFPITFPAPSSMYLEEGAPSGMHLEEGTVEDAFGVTPSSMHEDSESSLDVNYFFGRVSAGTKPA